MYIEKNKITGTTTKFESKKSFEAFEKYMAHSMDETINHDFGSYQIERRFKNKESRLRCAWLKIESPKFQDRNFKSHRKAK